MGQEFRLLTPEEFLQTTDKSEEAKAMADIEAERAMAIYCDDCQQDRDYCPDCCNGDKYVSPYKE